MIRAKVAATSDADRSAPNESPEEERNLKIHRFATGLLARDVATTTQFYLDHFGFRKTMDIGWFTSMGHDDPAYELSVVASEHDSVPAEFQRPTHGLLAFVVEDAAGEEARLSRLTPNG
jgi:hypothetical protein